MKNVTLCLSLAATPLWRESFFPYVMVKFCQIENVDGY